MWDVVTGEKVCEFKLSARYIRFPQFDASSRTLAIPWDNAAKLGSRTTLIDWQSGAEESSIDGIWICQFLPDGQSLVALQFLPNGHWEINRWDRANKSFRYHGIDLWHPETVAMQTSPDGRIIATPVGTGRKSIHPSLRPLLDGLGLGNFANFALTEEIVLLNSEDGSIIGRIPNINEVLFHADGKTVLAVHKGELQFWDIPPCKPLTWFTTVAIVLALLIALVTRRRCRSFRAGSVSDRSVDPNDTPLAIRVQ